MMRSGQAAAGVLLLLALHGCKMPQEKPAKGDKLVDAELLTLDGQRTRLLDVVKGKVAVFKFGATWCTWCNRQTPELNEVAKRYPKETVAVFDIDLQEPPALVKAHAQKHNTAYPTLLDPSGASAGKYSITSIPVVIIADHEQTVIYRGYYTRFGDLNSTIAAAAKKLEESRKSPN